MSKVINYSETKSIILIISENQQLPSELSSCLESFDFGDRFFIKDEEDYYYCTIASIDGLGLDLIKSPLYISADLSSYSGRYIIFEWKPDVNYFACYGSSNNGIKFAFSDSYDNLDKKGDFLNVLQNYESRYDLSKDIVKSMVQVKSWFFDTMFLYASTVENIILGLKQHNIREYFEV